MSDVDEPFVEQVRAEIRERLRDALPVRDVEMTVDARTGIATIPIAGGIEYRADAVGRGSNQAGTSVEHVRRDLQKALLDDRVKAIVFDVASSGGNGRGVHELGSEIRGARDQKPIVAFSDSVMASAGYALACQANRVYVTEMAWVGSIGVVVEFFSLDDDFRIVTVKSTPAKRAFELYSGVPDADCLSAAIASGVTIVTAKRADMQRFVDRAHEQFVLAIAAGRCIPLPIARRLADGRSYQGIEAQERGLVDEMICGRATAIEHARRLARERAAHHESAGKTSP